MAKAKTQSARKAPQSKAKAPVRKKVAPSKGLGANEIKWGATTHKQGWTYIPNILLEHQAELEISSAQLNAILTIMKHWWDKDNLPWPSVNKVAEDMGKSRSAVQRSIRELEEKKYIRRIYRKDTRKPKANLSNEYDFTGLVKAVTAISRKRQKEKTAAARTGAPKKG